MSSSSNSSPLLSRSPSVYGQSLSTRRLRKRVTAVWLWLSMPLKGSQQQQPIRLCCCGAALCCVALVLLLCCLALLSRLSAPVNARVGAVGGLFSPELHTLSSRAHFNGLLNRAWTDAAAAGEGDASSSSSSFSLSSLLFSAPSRPLQVCMATADVPFSATSGGTATAYLLLAKHLAASRFPAAASAVAERYNVTLVGLVPPSSTDHACTAHVARSLGQYGIHYECLRPSDMRDSHGRQHVSLHGWDRISLAVVRWLDRNHASCDVLHGHEWGGVLSYVALLLQMHPERWPGLRLMVEPHGGHMWSQIGSPTRPSDIYALRIDDSERNAVEWADLLVSPSRYMLGYFATRGWSVQHRLVVHNIIEGAADDDNDSDAELSGLQQQRKADTRDVWRLCFVGRLEERKGVKLFLDMLHMVAASGEPALLRATFEAWIIGQEAVIDAQPSSLWLRHHLQQRPLPFPVHVHVGLNRSAVLALVARPGVLLVLPSLQENLPYSVAEGAMLRVPLVTFAVGGSREVLQLHQHDKLTLCLDATAQCLFEHVSAALSRGSHHVPHLSRAMRDAAGTWTTLHEAYRRAHSQQPAPPLPRHTSAAATSTSPAVQVVSIPSTGGSSMLSFQSAVCDQEAALLPGSIDEEESLQGSVPELVLLLPDHFIVLPSAVGRAERTFHSFFSGLGSHKSHMRDIAAVTFGAVMDNATISYAIAPTWLLHSASDKHCDSLFPVLVRRHVLCQAFAVDVHAFPSYEPWLLADILNQQRMRLVSHPDVLFTYRAGQSPLSRPANTRCQPWSVPLDRYRSPLMLDHMHRDVSEELRDLYFPRIQRGRRVLSDFNQALKQPFTWAGGAADEQSQQSQQPQHFSFRDGAVAGWQLGAVDDSGRVHWFSWLPEQRRYGCSDDAVFPFPQVNVDGAMHPCRSQGLQCCGGGSSAAGAGDGVATARSLARYTLSGHDLLRRRRVTLSLQYTFQAACGDGVKLAVTFALHGPGSHSNSTRLLHAHDMAGQQQRGAVHERVELDLPIFTAGSTIDVTVDPLDNQDCDSLALRMTVLETEQPSSNTAAATAADGGREGSE